MEQIKITHIYTVETPHLTLHGDCEYNVTIIPRGGWPLAMEHIEVAMDAYFDQVIDDYPPASDEPDATS